MDCIPIYVEVYSVTYSWWSLKRLTLSVKLEKANLKIGYRETPFKVRLEKADLKDLRTNPDLVRLEKADLKISKDIPSWWGLKKNCKDILF